MDGFEENESEDEDKEEDEDELNDDNDGNDEMESDDSNDFDKVDGEFQPAVREGKVERRDLKVFMRFRQLRWIQLPE